MNPGAQAAGRVCFALGLAALRAQPLRALASLLALACGVALFTGVYLLNAVALNEFDQVTRRVSGAADLIVRGADAGFDERLYAQLAAREGVRIASPVLELQVALAGSDARLDVVGLDLFRAGVLQPALIGTLAADYPGVFESDAIHLSPAAARALRVQRGDTLQVRTGAHTHALRVRGLLPAERFPQPLGVMDIAAAQWRFGRLGLLNRIDLGLAQGTDVEAFARALTTLLPAGVHASTPRAETQRMESVSRSYRINLTMLALVSLLTGALLLFATQTFTVLRRRTTLGLLRALGATRGAVQGALLAEGTLLGAVASLLGIGLGYLAGALLLGAFRGGPYAGELLVSMAALRPAPAALAAIFLAGTLSAALGAWLPAREAARRAPARALKAGDAELALVSLRPSRAGLALLLLAGLLALLPPVAGVPLFGYLAIAALLLGGLLLVPACTVWLLRRVPHSNRPALDIGLAQIQGSITQLQISLAAVIVSFALMVAMAVMVNSFRHSFDQWLQRSLPADLQVRVAPGSGGRALDAEDQRRLRDLPGVAAVELRRGVPLLLDDTHAPALLSARDRTPADGAGNLPLLASVPIPATSPAPVWISEALQDLHGLRPGMRIALPLAGRTTPAFVAGVFRDYARAGGTVVMDRRHYVQVTGDEAATEASVWLQPRTDAARVGAALRTRLAAGASLQIRTTDEVRTLSMRAFDRAFEITYALEAAAVLIGLVGIACAGASTALARRTEFGVLRHLGMLRRQILAMLAAEGFALSALAALYGLAIGGAISLVLIHVVNRQSFNWSIDMAIPVRQLAIFAAALVIAATLTNVVSARAALRSSALRAVREDW